jgi:2-iminobutanoate/2-iminopropanoate deaminase
MKGQATMTSETTTELPKPAGPYSLAREAPGATVYVSGQIGVDPATGELRAGGIGEQTKQAIANISVILATQGCSLDNVVKVSVFLADVADFAAMNAAYSTVFRPPYPARTTVQAKNAAGADVEIDAIARSTR